MKSSLSGPILEKSLEESNAAILLQEKQDHMDYIEVSNYFHQRDYSDSQTFFKVHTVLLNRKLLKNNCNKYLFSLTLLKANLNLNPVNFRHFTN